MRKFLKSGVFLGNFRINNEKCQISEIWQLRISAENEFRDFDFRPIGLRTLRLWEVDSSYLAALVALPRQAVQQTIFVIKYSNVFKRKRVCMYSLLRFFVYILRSLGENSLDALCPLQTLATSYLNMPKKLRLLPTLPKNSDFS